MTVKAITKYQSTDGTLHDSMDAARKYDALQVQLNNIKLFFKGKHIDTVHIDICNNPELAAVLRNRLNKVIDYHRRYGKLSKPQVTATATTVEELR